MPLVVDRITLARQAGDWFTDHLWDYPCQVMGSGEMSMDARPRLAVGHVRLEVEDVDQAYAFFVRHGMRDIFKGEAFGVLELRGGTHLVLSRPGAPIEPGRDAPFDLMVDDIDVAREEFANSGVTATEIQRGRIHDTFHIEGPGGYRFAVTSSHAGDRAV